MTQPFPSVSAIVPCYNSEATIERCLNSILAQTLLVTEILVYNDCSCDDTARVLERMAAEHDRIRVFTGTENRGAGHARSTLLQAAKGDYLAFLDADDLWHPTKLEVQMNHLRREAADIVICDYRVVNPEGELLGIRRAPRRPITRFWMHLRDEIPTSMALLRADLEGCRAMPQIRRRQDYAYWLTVFARNPGLRCLGVPEILGTYYRMPGSLSSSKITNFKFNFRMFREVMGYSVALSLACLLANVLTRIVRV